MNFDEFFPLLKTIFTKKSCNITPTTDNFNLYLAVRYISFYHPSLCEIINESINKYKISALFNEPEESYKFLKALIPKLPYKHIKYIKKESIKKMHDKNISDDIINKLANYMEISKREIRHILETNYE